MESRPHRLAIIVCGKFHYPEYLHYLHRSEALDRFYFSYKVGSRFNIPKSARTNLFLKEYLLGLHFILFGEKLLTYLLPFYHWIWQKSLKFFFRPAQVNLFLLHGNCLESILAAKKAGRMVVLEAVNAHPTDLRQVLAQEASKIGFDFDSRQGLQETRIVEELRHADYLLAPSNAVAETFVARGFDRKRCIVIPYGCRPSQSSSRNGVSESHGLQPLARRSDAQSDSEEVRIVCVGQIMLRKGQHLAIQAVARAQQRHLDRACKTTFIGRADPRYLGLLRSYNVPFDHIPHIEHLKIRQELMTHDVFVLFSLEDGFAMAAIEAAEVGLPIIISRFAGVSELLNALDNVWVVDPHNSEEVDLAFDQALRFKGFGPRPPLQLPTWQQYAAKLTKTIYILDRPSLG